MSPRLTAAAAAAHVGAAQILPTAHGFTVLDAQGAGAPVVLVHGMTSPSLVWERVAPLLRAAGHRTVRYDLYGRGLSSRPDVALTPGVYHEQLDAVIANSCSTPPPMGQIRPPLNWPMMGQNRPPLNWPIVVGYSWGAGIVAGWASARGAEGVGRVILVAPGGTAAGAGPGLEPWTNTALRTPGLGEGLVTLFGRRGLLADVRRMFASPDVAEEYLARFVEQLEWEGYDRCFFSTLRHCPVSWEEAYAALGRTRIPVDVLWGDADAKVPIAGAERVLGLIPQAKLHVVRGGTHGMPWEAPGAFAAALVAAIREG